MENTYLLRAFFNLTFLTKITFLPVFLLISCKAFAIFSVYFEPEQKAVADKNAQADTQHTIKNMASSAEPDRLSDENFYEFSINVGKIKDKNPFDALTLLTSHENNLSALSVENQLVFYKVLAEVYVELAQYQQSKKIVEKALSLGMALPIPSITTAELLYARGFAIESLGDYEKAREDYLNGLEIADSLKNKKIVAIGLVNLGALDYLVEKYDRSLVMLNDALDLSQQIHDDELSGFIYDELGILYSFIGQEDKSLAHYKKSYEYYLSAGKTYYAFNTLRNIAANYSFNERYEEAIKIFRQITDNLHQISNNELIASTYSGMAWAHAKKADKDPEASYQYMLLASQYIEKAEQVDIPIAHALDKGYLFKELGKYEEALTSLNEAEEFFKGYESSTRKAVSNNSRLNLYFLSADIHYEIGNFQQAYQAMEKYMAFVLSLPEEMNIEEVEDLRMRYESKQADLQNKILEQENSVRTLKRIDSEQHVENRQFLVMIFSGFSVVLAWFLLQIILGQRKLLIIGHTDDLTGLPNRRRVMKLGQHYLEKAKKTCTPYTVILIDIDDFKVINDRFGHKQGDTVLKDIAKLSQNVLAKNQVLGRFGGEEFILLLPHVNKTEALSVAEVLRKKVCQRQWPFDESHSVTLSMGLVSLDEGDNVSFDEMLNSSDKLLYKAKSLGKNRVCHHG